MQNSDRNKILSTSFYREIRHIIIDDYETIDNKYINIIN